MQWALLVSGLTVGLIAVATIDDGDDTCHGLRLEWVEADDLIQEDLVALADEMWTHIQDGTLPEPDVASALPVVGKVFSTADTTAPVVDLDGFDVGQFAQIKAEIKSREEQLDLPRSPHLPRDGRSFTRRAPWMATR